MRRILLITFVLATAALTSGCVVRGQVRARSTAPELVYVRPGVQVVYDHDEPVFYSDSYYWRYHNGLWYRSSVHYGGWTRARSVPVAVRRVDNPRTYVRYRGRGSVQRGPAVRDHRRNDRGRSVDRQRGPAVRDHRSPPASRDHRAPASRDHRAPGSRDHRAPGSRDHRASPPASRDHRAPASRDHRAPGSRDHRAPPPATRQQRAPASQPAPRDHRGGRDKSRVRDKRRDKGD